MMKQAVIFSALLAGSLSFLSCGKSNDNNNNNNNNSQATLMTASRWKFSDAGLDLDNNGVKDNNLPPGTLSGCDTDNTITFKSDNTGVIDEGASKCDVNDPQSVPFTWSLKNTNEMTFSAALFPGINGDVKIVELTSTKLTMSKVVNYGGLSLNVIIFLTH
jgi:hypothetical protein